MIASDPTTEARPAWNRTQDPAAWVGDGGRRGKEKQAQGLQDPVCHSLNSFGGLHRIPKASSSPAVPIQQHLRGQESPQRCRKRYPGRWGSEVFGSSSLAPGASVCPRTWTEPGGYLFAPCRERGLPLLRPSAETLPAAQQDAAARRPAPPGSRCEEPAPAPPSRRGVEARPRGADSPSRPRPAAGRPPPRAARARCGPAGPSPRSVPGPWPPWRAPHRAGGRGRAPGAATGTSRLRDALRPGGCG